MNRFLDWLRPRRPAVPERKAVPWFALHGPGDAAWSHAGDGALAREGFMRNPVVYRCVRMVAEAAATLPFVLREDGVETDTHPLLALLSRPGPRQSGQEFLEALYGHLLVSGNAYVHAIALGESLRELHLLRPDRVAPIADDAGWPVAYEYAAGRTRMRIAADGDPPPILHLTQFNPLDEVAGLPPLAAAHMALDIHNAASRWNKALLDNSARPSGALVYSGAEGSNLGAEQFERLKAELEDGYGGAARAGRPMLLEGGLDWKAMGYSPRDMDFIEARNGAARDIALAFGVPPMLLGIPGDNTYANYQEASRALWRQTVLPLASRVTASLGPWLGSWFGESLTLDIDRDNVEALAADREALWRRLVMADFLTPDEKRAAAGYGPLRGNPGGDLP